MTAARYGQIGACLVLLEEEKLFEEKEEVKGNESIEWGMIGDWMGNTVLHHLFRGEKGSVVEELEISNDGEEGEPVFVGGDGGEAVLKCIEEKWKEFHGLRERDKGGKNVGGDWINTPNLRGDTVLHEVVRWGERGVRELHKKGRDAREGMREEGEEGGGGGEQERIVKLLMDFGADPSRFYFYCFCFCLSFFFFFFPHLLPSRKNKNGRTALMDAQSSPNACQLMLLLEVKKKKKIKTKKKKFCTDCFLTFIFLYFLFVPEKNLSSKARPFQ